MCRTGKRLRTLSQVKNGAKHLELKGKTIEIALVFMNPLDKNDIDEYENHFPIPYEKYFSRYIFSEDEIYLTDDSLKKDPFTIVLDGNGKVIYIETIGMEERSIGENILKALMENVK